MKNLLAPFLLAIFASLGWQFAPAQTPVITGPVSESATWQSSVIIDGTATIQPGVRIDVAPGTQVRMRSNAHLRVQGRLVADGTTAEIQFTRDSTSARWKQITFLAAEPSSFKNCVFEYANSAGSHLDYYDNDCNAATPPPARNYHEAVVLIASHVDFDGCTFRNLPDGGNNAEGDAMAIISDDPVTPGQSSSTIRNCQFIGIGQGIHTRFSPIVVEDCFFTRHHGDNDDIDLYGESTPPPLILNNRFIDPVNDDMINPTRCSAIIIGNFVTGGSDHGIVLRDKCEPVLINNVIADCSAGGISVQNQCNALLINNTIVDCGRGIRLFDHTSRWNAPYCLFPGSGKATLINCIIWNCNETLTLTNSPSTEDPGSHVTVISSNIQGGRSRASVSSNSTLTWGEGNIDADPRLMGPEFRLGADSPVIDAGIDPKSIRPEITLDVAVGRDGTQRPLDGNGDGTAAYDMGAYEFLLGTADSNGDGIPDGWLQQHRLDLLDAAVSGEDGDGDGQSTLREYAADTDPTSAASFFTATEVSLSDTFAVTVSTSAERSYTLQRSDDLVTWQPVTGQSDLPGTGDLMTLQATTEGERDYFRVEVKLP